MLGGHLHGGRRQVCPAGLDMGGRMQVVLSMNGRHLGGHMGSKGLSQLVLLAAAWCPDRCAVLQLGHALAAAV